MSVDGPQVCGAAGEKSLSDDQSAGQPRPGQTNHCQTDRQSSADPNTVMLRTYDDFS